MVTFQNAFRVEMHRNDIFFIFLKPFLRSAHQNDPKHKKKIILLQKKKEFVGNTGWPTFPNTYA
jgi:hypothetical protein